MTQGEKKMERQDARQKNGESRAKTKKMGRRDTRKKIGR